MAVERTKHYLTTKEYSVLTGYHNQKQRRANPTQKLTRSNYKNNIPQDKKSSTPNDPSLKEILQNVIEEFKDSWTTFK